MKKTRQQKCIYQIYGEHVFVMFSFIPKVLHSAMSPINSNELVNKRHHPKPLGLFLPRVQEPTSYFLFPATHRQLPTRDPLKSRVAEKAVQLRMVFSHPSESILQPGVFQDTFIRKHI